VNSCYSYSPPNIDIQHVKPIIQFQPRFDKSCHTKTLRYGSNWAITHHESRSNGSERIWRHVEAKTVAPRDICVVTEFLFYQMGKLLLQRNRSSERDAYHRLRQARVSCATRHPLDNLTRLAEDQDLKWQRRCGHSQSRCYHEKHALLLDRRINSRA